uniref:Uncharacterized protein n=1 Tax=Romanomermis culicivorax TaxID=13658 RepID=A0A915IUY3_ROMCU
MQRTYTCDQSTHNPLFLRPKIEKTTTTMKTAEKLFVANNRAFRIKCFAYIDTKFNDYDFMIEPKYVEKTLYDTKKTTRRYNFARATERCLGSQLLTITDLRKLQHNSKQLFLNYLSSVKEDRVEADSDSGHSYSLNEIDENEDIHEVVTCGNDDF